MVVLEPHPSVEAGSSVPKYSVPAPFPLARLIPEHCSVVLFCLSCSTNSVRWWLPLLWHGLAVTLPSLRHHAIPWFCLGRLVQAFTCSYIFIPLASGNAVWHQLALAWRSSMAVHACCCRYGCGHVCFPTPCCCQEKIIFLGFDASAVSKEEHGLNELDGWPFRIIFLHFS